MATLPSGTLLAVATSFAAAKTVTGISNATEAVVSCTAHGYSVGDILQIYSAWGRLNRRIVKVKSVTTNDFVATDIDTTNLEFFPAGSGGGTVRKVLTFTQISKYQNSNSSGGDPKPVTVKFEDEDTETTLNDGFTAVQESFEVDADQYGTPAYAALRALSDVQTDTVLKKTLKSGSIIYTPCTVALNENVKKGGSGILVNTVAISGNGRITRY